VQRARRDALHSVRCFAASCNVQGGTPCTAFAVLLSRATCKAGRPAQRSLFCCLLQRARRDALHSVRCFAASCNVGRPAQRSVFAASCNVREDVLHSVRCFCLVQRARGDALHSVRCSAASCNVQGVTPAQRSLFVYLVQRARQDTLNSVRCSFTSCNVQGETPCTAVLQLCY
jgi:hypothetical protein